MLVKQRECRCEEPRESADPRREGLCEKCSLRLSPAWTSNDDTFAEFFDRLEATFPGYRSSPDWEPPESFQMFRSQCQGREMAGRRTYGLRYLNRRNRKDAREEATDLALYMLFDSLREIRREGYDDDIDLALTAAWYAYKAYATTLDLKHKREHAP